MTITQSSSRFVAVVGGAVVALGLMFGAIATPAHAAALTSSQVSAIISLLQSFGADANTIANVQASLTGQPTTGGSTGGTTTTGGSCAATFTRSLTVGSTGADVMALQKFLNMSAATMVASSGAGSPGMETSTFGPATKAAVMKFQTANGIAPVSGYFGPLTMAKVNSLCTSTTGGNTTGGGSTTTTGTGTATVSAAAQPANGIAPNNAARVPFTKFTVTASGGNVTLNNVTVERGGIASDQAFSGVMLLDQNGVQVGISKTLNSNHQAVIGTPIVIPNGTSMTFTVAANRGNTSTYAGQIATFSVIAVNTSAAVTNGALPISGASQTINEASNLIGSITAQKGTNDPGSANQENVGQTSYIFSSIRLTAGSAEDTYLKSIRWHQVGSVSQSYLANLAVVVDGTSYPVTATTDNYFTATFPGQGILIQKGFSKDVAVQGDITNGSNTTVEFDIQKASDINVVGAQYGFGILPSYNGSGSATAGVVNSTDDPYYTGYQVTVQAGTVTVSTSNAVTATNVALNTQDQVLGGFSVQVQGEPVTVGKMIYYVGSTTLPTPPSYIDSTWVSNVKVVDQNGNVLAGPVDASAGVLTFTDSVTLPVGTTQLFIKGKLSTSFKSNDTVKIQTPSSGSWTNVVGQNTGKTLSVSTGVLTSAIMTVKAQALTLSVSATPIAQTVISGVNQFTFSNIVLDATNSGEDVRVTTLPVKYTYSGNANDVTNCQLYNGSTSVSSQHVVNPTSANTTGSEISFSLNSGGIVIPKGTSVTLSVACDLRSGASGTIKFGLASNSTWTGASGVTSGSTVSATFNASVGPTMSASSSGGALAVALDSSSPSYSVVSAGSTGVDLGHLNFSATSEAVDLRQVALQLTSGNNYDLVGNQVTLWDASTNTQIGTAVFASGSYATSSAIATGSFRIPANGNRVMIIKGDVATINVNGPITVSGDTLKVDYDGNNITGTNGTYGVGVSSGQNSASGTASDTAVKGAEIVKSFPTFTYSTAGAVAVNGNQPLLTLTIGADAKGDVTLNKLTFALNLSNATLTTLTFSGPNGSVSSSTVATSSASVLPVYFDSLTNTSDAVIPAGTTKTYTLRGTIALTGNSGQNGSVSTALKADTSAIAFGATSTTAVQNSYIIWSPESTTTSMVGTSFKNDWTNGYGLGGCFATSGLGQDCFANVVSK